MTVDKFCVLCVALTVLVHTFWIHRVEKRLTELVEDWEGEEEDD